MSPFNLLHLIHYTNCDRFSCLSSVQTFADISVSMLTSWLFQVGKFRSKEDRADAELRQLLGSDISDVESMQGTLPWRRTRRDVNKSFINVGNGNLTDGDDEILESLVKTATKGSSTRTAPRERKRTRHADRKSRKFNLVLLTMLLFFCLWFIYI